MWRRPWDQPQHAVDCELAYVVCGIITKAIWTTIMISERDPRSGYPYAKLIETWADESLEALPRPDFWRYAYMEEK